MAYLQMAAVETPAYQGIPRPRSRRWAVSRRRLPGLALPDPGRGSRHRDAPARRTGGCARRSARCRTRWSSIRSRPSGGLHAGAQRPRQGAELILGQEWPSRRPQPGTVQSLSTGSGRDRPDCRRRSRGWVAISPRPRGAGSDRRDPHHPAGLRRRRGAHPRGRRQRGGHLPRRVHAATLVAQGADVELDAATQWYSVTCWRGLARHVERSVRRESRRSGGLSTNVWVNSEGVEATATTSRRCSARPQPRMVSLLQDAAPRRCGRTDVGRPGRADAADHPAASGVSPLPLGSGPRSRPRAAGTYRDGVVHAVTVGAGGLRPRPLFVGPDPRGRGGHPGSGRGRGVGSGAGFPGRPTSARPQRRGAASWLGTGRASVEVVPDEQRLDVVGRRPRTASAVDPHVGAAGRGSPRGHRRTERSTCTGEAAPAGHLVRLRRRRRSMFCSLRDQRRGAHRRGRRPLRRGRVDADLAADVACRATRVSLIASSSFSWSWIDRATGRPRSPSDNLAVAARGCGESDWTVPGVDVLLGRFLAEDQLSALARPLRAGVRR